MDSTHNCANPASVSLNELRRIVKRLCLGEQIVNLLDTVLIGMCKEALLQAAEALGITNNCFHCSMRKNLILLLIVVKYVSLHIIVSFRMSHFIIIFIVVIVVYAIIFHYLADHCIDNSLLLFRKRVKHVFDSLFAFCLLNVICHFIFLLFVTFCRMNNNIFIIPGIKFRNRIFICIITMSHNTIDISSRICSGEN